MTTEQFTPNKINQVQPESDKKTTSGKKTLEQEIEAAAAKLRRLQELQKEAIRKEREKNEKAVRDLIKSEKLEDVSIEVWRAALSEIRAVIERHTNV